MMLNMPCLPSKAVFVPGPSDPKSKEASVTVSSFKFCKRFKECCFKEVNDDYQQL